jgi:type IV secretory pathway VirB2 component (pilin)
MISLLKAFAVACTPANVNGDNYCTDLPQAGATSANLQNILQIVIGTFAVVAVLIIVIAGLNIVTAGGDPSKVAKARGAIIYALVGLVVAIMAEAIVSLVIGHI